MTVKEMVLKLRESIYNISRAMSLLHKLGLVRHPENRIRSWIADSDKSMVRTLEKLLLVSKDDPDIKELLASKSVIRIGAQFYKDKKSSTIRDIMNSTGLSKTTVIRTLEKIIALNLLNKKVGKQNIYYISNTITSQLFFQACNDIAELFTDEIKKETSPKGIIKMIKNEQSVLILVHYGSSARGRGDKLSDMDLFVVTRDKIERGDIISRYSQKNVDLSVYSKKGFLQLIKSRPDFIANIATGKIIKGKDILEAVIQ